jgi:hypothetical protein
MAHDPLSHVSFVDRTGRSQFVDFTSADVDDPLIALFD